MKLYLRMFRDSLSWGDEYSLFMSDREQHWEMILLVVAGLAIFGSMVALWMHQSFWWVTETAGLGVAFAGLHVEAMARFRYVNHVHDEDRS